MWKIQGNRLIYLNVKDNNCKTKSCTLQIYSWRVVPEVGYNKNSKQLCKQLQRNKEKCVQMILKLLMSKDMESRSYEKFKNGRKEQ